MSESNPVDEPAANPDPKKLSSTDVASIFDLRNELLKSKTQAATRKPAATGFGDYAVVGKKGGVLTVKKDEKQQLKSDASERKRKITEYERAMKAEEAEMQAKAARILQEKTELYDKLQSGSIALTHKDDTPVEFMVDFQMKKRHYEEEADRRAGVLRRDEDDAPDVGHAEAGPSKVVPERFNPAEEQRLYGVSHFRLSQDEEKRQEQIQNLYALSDQTVKERSKRAELLKKREAEKKAKMTELRQRMGLPAENEPSTPPEPDVSDIPLPAVVEKAEPLEKRIKSDREWDRGKGTYNTWLQTQRDEREDEFRPPDFYYK